MSKFIFLIPVLIISLNSCALVNSIEAKKNSISFDDTTFSKTEFVTVIPEGQTAVIPDSENCTPIDDVFLETRTITLSSFSMCKYEVTQELYQAVTGKNPCADEENLYKGEKQKFRPVTGVNWYEAVIFCNALSDLCGYDKVYTITNIKKSNSGKENEYVYSATVTWDLSKNGFRLPTEAEWEFASRAAGNSAEDWKYKYSGGDISKQVAWTNINSSGNSDNDETYRSHQVGLKKANALGIFDMSGNAAEWCMDWYRSVTENNDFSHGNAVNDSGAVTDPILLKGNYDNHVIRGGSYSQTPGYALNWQRLGLYAPVGYGYDGTSYNGIRLVRRP